MSKNTYKCHNIKVLGNLFMPNMEKMGYYYHVPVLIYNTCVDGLSGLIFVICFLLIDDA